MGEESLHIVRGLAYLHSSSPPYIHHDIKSSVKSIVLVDILSVPLFCSPNVLLDAELRAVVADFRFVSALPETVGSTTVVTAAGALSLAWSRGYIAPEVTDGKHGAASDVYSYGVVRRWCICCISEELQVTNVGCFGDIYWIAALFRREGGP